MNDRYGEPMRGDDGDDGDQRAVEDTIIRLVEPAARTAERAIDVAVDEVLRVLPAVGPRARAVDDVEDDALDGAASEPAEWMLAVRGTSTLVPLDRPVIVGRAPGAARFPDGVDPRRLVVPKDRRGISSTHARIEQVGDSLVVTDLGSTNGVAVHWASGATRRLRPGESCVALPDASIDLGDGIVIEFRPNPTTHEEHP